MEKQAVIQKVKQAPSSVFTKQDVLDLLESIEVFNVVQLPKQEKDEEDKIVDLYPIYVYPKQIIVMFEKSTQEYMSLFDYLGHPAGTALGTQVYEAAKRCKEKTDTRIVSTKTYNGKVLLYRKAFLQEYFASKRV